LVFLDHAAGLLTPAELVKSQKSDDFVKSSQARRVAPELLATILRSEAYFWYAAMRSIVELVTRQRSLRTFYEVVNL